MCATPMFNIIDYYFQLIHRITFYCCIFSIVLQLAIDVDALGVLVITIISLAF